MRKTLLLCAAALLTGCATYNADGVQALNRGDSSAAERLFMQGVERGDPMSINNMGVVYERRGDRNAAIQNYTLAARWGVPIAQQNLARLGQPVPPADLAAQRQQVRDQQSAALYQAARYFNPPPPQITPTVNCTSNRFGDMVQTTCR
jgi:Flp pilus assembly protein TadD